MQFKRRVRFRGSSPADLTFLGSFSLPKLLLADFTHTETICEKNGISLHTGQDKSSSEIVPFSPIVVVALKFGLFSLLLVAPVLYPALTL